MSENYGSGNPDPDMENFLLKYFNTLREEIECLNPSAVILMTGKNYDECLEFTFPNYTLLPIIKNIGTEEIARLGGVPGIVIRTPHPQGWEGIYEKIGLLYNYLRPRI